MTNTTLEQAETLIEHHTFAVRRYVPGLTQRIMKTYAVPLVGMIIVSIITLLVRQITPGVFGQGIIGTAATTIVMLVVLVRGWQWGEKRYKGTSLFIVFSTIGRERRLLKGVIEQVRNGMSEATLEQVDLQAQAYTDAVTGFIDTARDCGVEPIDLDKKQ